MYLKGKIHRICWKQPKNLPILTRCNLFTACSQVPRINYFACHSQLSAANGSYAVPMEINNSEENILNIRMTNYFTEIYFQWNWGRGLPILLLTTDA